MFSSIFEFFLLIPLFYLLSLVADFVVFKIKALAEKIGFDLGTMGAILGLLTSIPELSVSFNAVAMGDQSISMGNLMGGIVVIFCLILGISLVLNRKIKTDGKIFGLSFVGLALILPLLLGLKGYLNFFDGLILVSVYFLIIRYKFARNLIDGHKFKIIKIETLYAWRELFSVMIGAFSIILISNFIMRTSADIVNILGISPFIMGLVVFSVGTNLPEIILTVKSWKQNASELSLNYLLGSAMANILIMGIMVLPKRIEIALDPSYYFILISLIAIVFSFIYFYRSDRELTRKEGYILISYYLIFLIGQVIFS